MNRPDFSNYLAHFTKDGDPCSADDHNVANNYKGMNAKERLISILREKSISASLMPWTGSPAVCFTECPWSSLIGHTQVYSPYGIGFEKSFIYSRHGGPVYYIRPDHYNLLMKNDIDAKVKPFLTPFAPAYRNQYLKKIFKHTVDYSHEREWRIPHEFKFEHSDIKFVILKDYHDMVQFPSDLKDAIGREKFILMDNYKHIEELWPVHLL